MLWFLFVLFFALAVLFLCGKGAFLIAGYNTVSADEKAMYDEKKLCRIMGCVALLIAAMLFVWALLQDRLPSVFVFIFVAVVLVATVVAVLLANTVAKKKKTSSAASVPHKKNVQQIVALLVVVCLVLCTLGVGIAASCAGHIEVTFDAEQMSVFAPFWKDASLSKDSILDVSYTENLDVGTRTNGLGTSRYQEGQFQNDRFGSYTLYAYTQCSSYVVLQTENGVVVLNDETPQCTKQLYQSILEFYT